MWVFGPGGSRILPRTEDAPSRSARKREHPAKSISSQRLCMSDRLRPSSGSRKSQKAPAFEATGNVRAQPQKAHSTLAPPRLSLRVSKATGILPLPHWPGKPSVDNFLASQTKSPEDAGSNPAQKDAGSIPV
eukprot:CAMPEP_0118893770 /NCGR_PEP_ID=MMETSP1166-20130328/2850_1 /TAXON_ID=1104430 /ORGANISM="Chrysoreinhardia sp, Strain CCMP3193" /LENGTH=131 /DNA_ID=CAMNT_0006832627 /DNA_START=248 /DNA_END=643 /DNA_ORIENTATION=+